MMTTVHDCKGVSDSPNRLALHVDGFGTLAIHAGSEPDPGTGAVIPPISLGTTYKQDEVANRTKGFQYSRFGNPNRQALEITLAALETGGTDAIVFSSGSAVTATLIQTVGPNAHILSMNDVYGGTSCYLKQVALDIQMVDTTFLDLSVANDDVILAALQPNTKLIWIETPTNPTLRVVDIPRIVSLARSHPSRPLVVVDNTFLSPFYQSPLSLGADVVMHSLSKYINGHTDVIMGAVIVPAHHAGLVQKLRFLQAVQGAVPSAFDCWLVQRGIKTLHLRMKAHSINALRVAQALARSPLVEEVIYPGLASHPRNALAYRQLSPRAKTFVDAFLAEHKDDDGSFPYGGMVSFRIRGGWEEATTFMTVARLFTLAGSLGGVESLCQLPALMTHAGIPEDERAALGISENLIRLSVGVEETEDLVKDIEQALEVAVQHQ